jgi:hypothetical protein
MPDGSNILEIPESRCTNWYLCLLIVVICHFTGWHTFISYASLLNESLFMKSMKTIAVAIITGIFISGCAFSAEAQTKPEKTSSAKAYYGNTQGRPKVNVNKKKKSRAKSSSAKAIRREKNIKRKSS